jgi:hypothetical protein
MADIKLTPRPDGTGQTAVGVCTFDEAPPSDGAFASDTPTVATVSLAADLATYTVTYVSNGTAMLIYSGTSQPPAVGPVVMAHNPISVMCTSAPVAETGDTNPGSAVVS